MPHGFQRICTIIKEVGLINLNRAGLEGQGEEPSPECAKITETTVVETSKARIHINKKRSSVVSPCLRTTRDRERSSMSQVP